MFLKNKSNLACTSHIFWREQRVVIQLSPQLQTKEKFNGKKGKVYLKERERKERRWKEQKKGRKKGKSIRFLLFPTP